MAKPTILCVDDEIDNVEALERLFRKKFDVLKATSGQEALQILDQHRGPIAVIVTDQRMPQMTGVEFLQKTLTSHPETIRLLLTGYTDLESVIGAVNQGQIYRYLTKPWDPVDLVNTMDRAVERFELGQELKRKNAELEKAYAELKTLDTAKSNFMILVNHELKTPLTTILNFSAILAETKMDEEQALFVDRIRKSGDRLRTLIDDVLLVVRAETGKLKADLRATDVMALALPWPEDLQLLAQKKSQNFQSQIEPTQVQADPTLIRQVFHRLLHNAAKFGNENSNIQLRGQITNGVYRFFVENRGTPISPNVIEHIFRPFFLDEDIMHHSTGLGLGLTICQCLLQAHQSRLQIENLPDGVRVFFDLELLERS